MHKIAGRSELRHISSLPSALPSEVTSTLQETDVFHNTKMPWLRFRVLLCSEGIVSACSQTISFLGRNSSSSSLPPPGRKKCNSGGSRSFIFSRDDSNSNHGIPSSNQANGDEVLSSLLTCN